MTSLEAVGKLLRPPQGPTREDHVTDTESHSIADENQDVNAEGADSAASSSERAQEREREMEESGEENAA